MKSEKTYACPRCGLKYDEKKWADKCLKWCQNHPTCNIEIIKHAVNEKK